MISRLVLLCVLFAACSGLFAQQVQEENGQAKLDSLLSMYHNRTEWESRKAALQKCMISTLHVDRLPHHRLKVIKTAARKYPGYTVQNIALETLPGLYVCGSIYRPAKVTGRSPLVISPNGHFSGGRYRSDQQYLCATLARMGVIAFSYDLFGWGESRLQVKEEDHYTKTAMRVQSWNNIKIIDYLTALPEVDTSRVAMTGASGGGSQTMLTTALDTRIRVSVPVVMLSAHFPGGCPCETGYPVHACGKGTNNAEIAAMAAPRPQLVISISTDWTKNVPVVEFPYLREIYGYYGAEKAVTNVHLGNEEHNYGITKRQKLYDFLGEQFQLEALKNAAIQPAAIESGSVIEKEELLLVFGKKGEKLPAHAWRNLEQVKGMLGE